jgi:GR25 family glycosyltransferase involved in LPS biosynthesis
MVSLQDIPILIITLPQDKKRYHKLEDNLCRINPNRMRDVYKIDAVDGRRLSSLEKTELCSNPFFRFIQTPSMLGCAASHLKALKFFVESVQSEWCIILEDDAIVHSLSFSIPHDILKNTDIILLGSKSHDMYFSINKNTGFPSRIKLNRDDDDTIPESWKIDYFLCSSSYMISRRSAIQVIECLSNGHLYYHYDLLMNGICKKKKIRIRACPISLATTDDDNTTSHNEISFPVFLDLLWKLFKIPSYIQTGMRQSLFRIGVFTVSFDIIFFFLFTALLPPSLQIYVIIYLLIDAVFSRSMWCALAVFQSLSIMFLSSLRIFWSIVWTTCFVFSIVLLCLVISGAILPV